MILQALMKYYDRVSSSDTAAVTEGFQKQDIPFLIILDHEGNFMDIQDTRSGEGKKKISRSFTVPKAVKKTSGVAANLLWDTPAYVAGRPKPDPKKDQDQTFGRAEEQRQAFIKRIRDAFPANKCDSGVSAVLRFLEQNEFQDLFIHPYWREIEDNGSVLSFKIVDENCLVCERPMVVQSLKNSGEPKSVTSPCIVTGDQDVPVRLHTAIKGVWGAQSSGANIVSFNLGAFTSYGKEQGFNAPVGKRAEFAYTTALNNYLLKKGSRQRIQVGDTSTVFWAEKKHAIEDVFANIFGEPAKDNPVQDCKPLIAMFRAPHTGVNPDLDPETKFYVLGLAPNAARIAVRFWYTGTVQEVADNIWQHFEDCSIVHGPNQPETLSLFRLLVSTAVQSDSKNIQPNLSGEFMRSILTGTPYPYTLLSAAVQRIRAEHEITYPRVSLIKAVLSRDTRYHKRNHKEVGMALDVTNGNIGYRMGRLFAVLEKIQEEASPGINATIRDRFYGAASGTPVAAFPHLMKLKNHHLSKLENRGRAVNFERMLGEIIQDINEFPTHLSLPDQGRFAVGYYHQRQDFFTKKDTQ